MSLRAKVQSILNHFTYSSKLNTVLLTGGFCVFFLGGVLTFLQERHASIKQEKLRGLAVHRELNALMDKACRLQVLLFSPDESILVHRFVNQIDNSLNKLNINLFHSSQDEVNRRADALYNKLQHLWRLFKNSPDKTLLNFVDSLDDLMQLNLQMHALDLGYGILNTQLQDALTTRLPRIQKNAAYIIYYRLTNQGDRHLEQEAALLSHNREFLQQLFILNLDIGDTPNYKSIEETSNIILSNTPETQAILVQAAGDFCDEIEKSSHEIQNQLESRLINDLDQFEIHNLISLGIITFGSLMVFLMFLTPVIRRPLENLKIAARKISEGEFFVRVPITAQDEVGDITKSFNRVGEFLTEEMEEIKCISEQLFAAASTIKDGSYRIENSLIEQQEGIRQISSLLKELMLASQAFLHSFSDMTTEAAQTSMMVYLGSSGLTEMDNDMRSMVEASRNIVDALGLLKIHVERINGVINTIVQIADQSNLLSLNTAIKSSQCALKGSGFSVIAGKIRELADQTALGTLDIEKAVQGINEVIADSLKGVESFSAQILSQVDEDKNFQEKFKKLFAFAREQMQSFETVRDWLEEQSLQATSTLQYLNKMSDSTKRLFKNNRRFLQEAELLFQSVQQLKEMTGNYHCQNTNSDEPTYF